MFTSWRLIVWVVDNFWRRYEGKSEGLDCVTMVFEAVSWGESCQPKQNLLQHLLFLQPAHSPWFSAPQHSHCRMFFELPLEAGKRFPQSVQKTRDPIADILSCYTFPNQKRSRDVSCFQPNG